MLVPEIYTLLNVVITSWPNIGPGESPKFTSDSPQTTIKLLIYSASGLNWFLSENYRNTNRSNS